jgi:hypothetical protein
VFSQLLHMGSDEHLTELDKVTMRLVVDLNDTPGIGSSSDTTAVGSGNNRVGSDHGERYLALCRQR